MEHTYDLNRFTQAHQSDFDRALQEIRNGRKESHWMWYIFPQVRGLGRSAMSDYFGISGPEEGAAFLADPYLGGNLREICQALLELPGRNAVAVLGHTDAQKLCSSMTLFQYVSKESGIFTDVLEKYFRGEKDENTLRILKDAAERNG